MAVPADILGFIKAHPTQRVLTVYLDGGVADATVPDNWRVVLRQSVDTLRARLTELPDDSSEVFSRCVMQVESRLPTCASTIGVSGRDWPISSTRGWLAMCAEDGELVEARLSVSPSTLVTWGNGPTIVPYLSATRTNDAVILLVDEDHATIARLQRGVVQLVEQLTVDREPKGAAHDLDAHDRLFSRARRALAVVAGHDAKIVIGGRAESVVSFVATLPNELAMRCAVCASLDMHTPFTDISTLAHEALTDVLTRRQLETLAALDRRAHLTRHAAFGYSAVVAAAAAGAVERLYVSEALWRRQPSEVEALVQRAMRAGACVETATAECAMTLDDRGGVAAELRFAVPAASETEPAGVPRADESGHGRALPAR